MTRHKLYPLSLLPFLIASIAYGQNKAKLTFKDGTVLQGYGKFTNTQEILFRKTKKDGPTQYSLKTDLKKASIFENGIYVSFVYQDVKNKKKGKLLMEIIDGKVSLYTEVISNYNYTPTGNPPESVGAYRVNYSGVENSFVKRKGETAVTHIRSSKLLSKKFRKVAFSFFKDCPNLAEKIKKKVFRSRDLIKIVEYYNENCN